MAVIARMRCTSVNLVGYGTIITLQPVVAPQADDPHAEEIKAFYAATPTGKFEATIKNEVAAEQFQPGDEFYVSLERVQRDG